MLRTLVTIAVLAVGAAAGCLLVMVAAMAGYGAGNGRWFEVATLLAGASVGTFLVIAATRRFIR